MTLDLIYQGVFQIISGLLRREHSAQGHYLTGTFDNSLTYQLSKNALIGLAVDYARQVNEGLEPDEISFKMYPGLVRYFRLRGFPENEANRIARATIFKWRQEGMSTQASKRFSKTGARNHFIEAAFLYPEIDQYMVSTFDFAVDEEYHKTKSETI